MKKDIIIFGAGQVGQRALLKYSNRVDYFIDNCETLWGNKVQGYVIKSVSEGVADIAGHTIVIASRYQDKMEKQLQDSGIENYLLYLGDTNAYYETDELIINPYQASYNRDLSEEAWNEASQRNYEIKAVNDLVEQLQGQEPLLEHIEIETINQCNGNCDFCPASKKNDTRERRVMTDSLFENIINQLAEIDYRGKLGLFSNNEPFLDNNILLRHKYAREKLPKARMHLFTNGTLLTIERFKELMLYLDELIIDNYQQDLKLIKPCQEIAEYCEKHPELKKRVTIVLRKPQEILSTRGGDAPNRKNMVSYKEARCALPYKQMIIRPDGKVSLCCNDPLGKNTLGDLTKDSILDVWNNDRFKTVRKCLYQGRGNWKHCEYCDFFSVV